MLAGILIGVALTISTLMVLALFGPDDTPPDPTWYPDGDEA